MADFPQPSSAANCGEEALMLGALDDEALEAKLKRYEKLTLGFGSKLCDNGDKLKGVVRAIKDEIRRREARRDSEVFERCNVVIQASKIEPSGNISVTAKNSEASTIIPESLSRCSITSGIIHKLEDKEDAAHCKDLGDINQDNDGGVGTSNVQRDEDYKHKISSESARSSCRDSPFQSVSSLCNKRRKRPLDDIYRGAPKTPCVQTLCSSRRSSPRIKNILDWKFKKVKEVFIVDEDDIEPVQSCEGDYDKWKDLKVYYPSRDDPESVELSYEDLKCLDPEEYLPSNIINFYIQYLQKEVPPSCSDREQYLFFNTYFYKKLEDAISYKGDKDDCFKKLRRWWKGINIFQKSYIFIPIHADLHWSLVIVCILAKEDGSGPIILHLDSLGLHNSNVIFDVITRFLKEEWICMKQSVGLPISERGWNHLPRIEKKKIKVPQQKNEYDCGLFVLYFMERFITEAPLRFRKENIEKINDKKWFQSEDASDLRKQIRNILCKLFEKEKTDTISPDKCYAEETATLANNSDAGISIQAPLLGEDNRTK